MDLNAYVGEVIAGFAYLFVSVRLVLLSRRTRQLPETLMALSFGLWTVGFAFYDIPHAFIGLEQLAPAVFSFGSLSAFVAGNIAFAAFTRAVFRSDARWATALVVAIAVSSAAGLVGMGWMGDWDGVNVHANPWYWIEFFGTNLALAWMAVEGFAQYFKTRRRLPLGLCEPMDCNRFLLWGMSGLLWVVLEVIVTVSDCVYASTGAWSDSLGLAIALFEIVPIAMVSFAFFPPAFYFRWIEGAAA